MVSRLRTVLLLALVFWCLAGRDASAQHPAEQKLAAGDDVAAARLAEGAIFAGALKPEQWSALQFTLAVALARTGEPDRARRAFICALSLDPGRRLRGDEAVEVRSPFMEARGFWSQYAQRLGASAALSEDRSALLIALVDPAALVARVVVRARGVGQSRFVEMALPTASSVLMSLEALPAQDGVEYTLALIDENANRLWQLGTDAAPLRAGAASPERAAPAAAPAPAASIAAPASSARAASAVPAARPYYVGAAVSFAVSAAAFVVAGISHAERQKLASRWNRADCDGEGSTRGEVCSEEHDQLQRQERIAVSSYAVAGAGLVAGLITLIVAPSRAARSERRTTTALRCTPGPGAFGVACGKNF
jgi:hypothetical protein